MATETSNPDYTLTLTTLQQVEQWIEIAKNLDVSEFSKAFPALDKKLLDLNEFRVCGTEEQQVSILKRLTMFRKQQKLLGPVLDETIRKRIWNLARNSGNQGLAKPVSTRASEHRYFDLKQVVVGNEHYNNVTLVLDETTQSLQPFLGQAKIGYKDGAFAIQFNLVHSMLMTSKAKKLRIHLVLDREVKLEMIDSINLFNFGDKNELVKVLESFTGKICQLVDSIDI